MQQNYDAIVIGSGIGGLGIGALLAHFGKRVLVLEKNKVIGGRCSSYKYKGFTLDLGNHLFALGDAGPVGEICRRCGRNDAIKWIKNRSSNIQIGSQVRKYNRKMMMEAVPATERQSLEKLFEAVYQITDDEINKLWYVPLDQWVSRFSTDPAVYALIESISSQYFCIPLADTSAGEFVKCFRDTLHARSSAYPRGGCIAIPNAFSSIIAENRGEVRLSTPVKSIIVKGDSASGVVLDNGETIFAPIIISNADIKFTVQNLVGESYFPREYTERIKSLTYSYQSVMIKVGLCKKVTEDQLLMFMPEKFSPILKVSDQIREGKIPGIVGGMIVVPTNYDPALAPEGQQLISFGSACTREQDWGQWKKAMMDSLFMAYPKAESRMLWCKLDTPALVEAYAGEQGNIIGIGQTVDQISEKRPKVQSPLNGLYFSSAEAGGHGVGVELAASSALELYDVLKVQKLIW
jgi:phytoene dehydrogenase-like protein